MTLLTSSEALISGEAITTAAKDVAKSKAIDKCAGIPLIMETPSQSPGPKLNYPKSLLSGNLVYREDVTEVPESTDCRDVKLLYSLIR